MKNKKMKVVILCGGAINSPQILELSGIGNRSILEEKGISLVHELKGVGENLRDHLGPRLVYNITKRGISYNDKARGINLIKQVLTYAFKREGFLTYHPLQFLDFSKLEKNLLHLIFKCILFHIRLC